MDLVRLSGGLLVKIKPMVANTSKTGKNENFRQFFLIF
jgi:hypothetical protein